MTFATGLVRLRAALTGVALASNIGGMTSPISSPQNIFAIEQMGQDGTAPSWLAWFAVSLPVAAVGALLIWGVLLLVYPPNVKAVHRLPELKVSALEGNCRVLRMCGLTLI